MAKKKTIDGIVYYPQKCVQNCNCSKCNKFIYSNTLVYSAENINSTKIVCVECVNKIFLKNQEAKNKEATEYPTEQPLYVGTKHDCKKTVYETIPFYFINNNKSQKINIKKCPFCQKYFIEEEDYNKKSFYFHKYKLINTHTGKELIKFTLEKSFYREQQKTVQEIPSHLQWAAKHPYQGGGCSGK